MGNKSLFKFSSIIILLLNFWPFPLPNRMLVHSSCRASCHFPSMKNVLSTIHFFKVWSLQTKIWLGRYGNLLKILFQPFLKGSKSCFIFFWFYRQVTTYLRLLHPAHVTNLSKKVCRNTRCSFFFFIDYKNRLIVIEWEHENKK